MESTLGEQKCKNIENKICFKSVKGSCIDLILTSRPSLYQIKKVFETGTSDFHLLIYTILIPILRWSQTFLQRDVLKSFQNNPSFKS